MSLPPKPITAIEEFPSRAENADGPQRCRAWQTSLRNTQYGNLRRTAVQAAIMAWGFQCSHLTTLGHLDAASLVRLASLASARRMQPGPRGEARGRWNHDEKVFHFSQVAFSVLSGFPRGGLQPWASHHTPLRRYDATVPSVWFAGSLGGSFRPLSNG
jgi:hypothetical protein